MLAEATTTELTKATNPKGLEENKQVAKKSGSVAGNTRKEIEQETGRPVITSKNAMDLSRFIEDVVKEPINKTEANKEKINKNIYLEIAKKKGYLFLIS